MEKRAELLCKTATPHELYGLQVALPREIGTRLRTTTRRPTLQVIPSGQELGQSNRVFWYHRWYDSEGCWLSAGRRCDGWYVLRFRDAAFSIAPDGKVIRYDTALDPSSVSSRHFLLNQVVPMVMNLRGVEVLHASSVLTSQGAVVFVGNGGYGKSTLAASLIREQFPLLSDDAVPLVVRGQQVWTSSGPAEMGLWPRARRLLNRNDDSPNKLLVPLIAGEHQEGEFPLARIYFLKPSDQRRNVAVEPASKSETFLELVRAAHRLDLTDGRMLERQVNTLHQVASQVSARTVEYPVGVPDPDQLRTLVLSDLM